MFGELGVEQEQSGGLPRADLSPLLPFENKRGGGIEKRWRMRERGGGGCPNLESVC